jgi:hypothetical protein
MPARQFLPVAVAGKQQQVKGTNTTGSLKPIAMDNGEIYPSPYLDRGKELVAKSHDVEEEVFFIAKNSIVYA